jgi:hypothetical protein
VAIKLLTQQRFLLNCIFTKSIPSFQGHLQSKDEEDGADEDDEELGYSDTYAHYSPSKCMFSKLECAGPLLRYFTISCCIVYVMVYCLVFVSENWKESP